MLRSEMRYLTKREQRTLIKMIYSAIARDISDARIAVATSYDDLLVNRLDRIQAYAFADMVYIIED